MRHTLAHPPSTRFDTPVRRRHLTVMSGGLGACVTPVGIAARSQIVRAGLRALLESDDQAMVVGDAETTDQAVGLAGLTGALVVLIHLGSDEFDAVEATRRIVDGSGAHVLLVSDAERDERVLPALLAGAAGVVTGSVESRALCDAVRAVARGRVGLTPSATHSVIAGHVLRRRVGAINPPQLV